MPFQPFNAANTLSQATDIQGARTRNALQEMFLQQEQDPQSSLNRAREIGIQSDEVGLNVVRQQLEQAQRQNAIPKLHSVLGAIGQIKQTVSSRGVAAGRQRLAERISFLQGQGILPEDFELGTDLDALSDEDFVRGLEEEEQNLVGTLMSIMPPPEARTSAAIGDMMALGIPLTPEGFQQYNESKGGGSEELETLIAQARLQGALIEQSTKAEDRARAAEERRQERTATQQSIVRNLEGNQTAVDMTQRLEGTMLESGSVIPADFRRGLADLQQLATGLTGGDTSDIAQVISDFDTQRKVLEDQVNLRIASGDYGQSAAQLQSLQRSLANPNISPPAIIRIQGQLGQMDLDRADALEIDIPDREKYEKQVKEWKNYSPISASSISKMTRQQLSQLDIDSLSDEQAEAALKRLDALQ